MAIRQRMAAAMPWGSEGRASKRIERLEQDNERLKTENAAIRDEFKEARSLQKRMLDVLENRPMVEVKKRRGGLIRVLLVASAACLVGMRLGRERYEQLFAQAKEGLAGAKERLGGAARNEQVVTVPDAGAPEMAPEPETSSASGTSPRTARSRGKE
jgi:hypothetical protein